MKSVTIICCILLCILFGLSACSKSNVDPSPVDTTGSDPKYQPGDTLVLRGDTSNNDQTALLYSRDAGIPKSYYPSFKALNSDGSGGVIGKYRSVMKFRIRHIDDSTSSNPPPIQKAELYLYQYSTPAELNPYTIQQDASNGVELHRIVGDWEDSTVTWVTQPALAQGSANPLEDVVIIPPVTTPLSDGVADNLVIDVTDMMRKVFESQSNKGFLLKLSNEDANAGRSYGSFAAPLVSKRPRLVIYF
jgi:hypothetical protein